MNHTVIKVKIFEQGWIGEYCHCLLFAQIIDKCYHRGYSVSYLGAGSSLSDQLCFWGEQELSSYAVVGEQGVL